MGQHTPLDDTQNGNRFKRLLVLVVLTLEAAERAKFPNNCILNTVSRIDAVSGGQEWQRSDNQK